MAIRFQDVTSSAGISLSREETFSVAWTDFNSDGRPDLWISPHGYGTGENNRPRLYLNQGNGSFANITSQVWPASTKGDAHGSSWADFDNDGDLDLFVSVGAQRGTGVGRKKLFVNNDGQLQNQAAALGLEYPLGRGRASLWFDYDKDGLLDILQLNENRPDGQAPTALFRQTANGFEDVSTTVGLQAGISSSLAQLADLTGDGVLDLLIPGGSNFPGKVYDTTTTPFQDLTSSFPSYSSVRDTVVADFDGDLRSDLFLVRNKLNSATVSSITQVDDQVALAQLVANTGEVGVSFKTTGEVLFDFRAAATGTSELIPDKISPSDIFIGSEGRNPTAIGFSLSPNDPTAWGIKPHTPGSEQGLYIGYDPVNQTWQALLSSPQKKTLSLIVDPTEPLSDMTRIGFGPLNLSQYDGYDVLLLHDSASNQYVNRTTGSGLGNLLLGRSAVAGDFDNDMDVDLYISQGYKTYNLPSSLYENRGNGTFVKVANAGGAAGRNLEFQYAEFSASSRLSVADYDVDGFLDLFTSNTVFDATQNTYLGSPHQLFRNQGNSNHWIELDLEGVVSNRDGIGARVLATAGGVTQLREQGGGMHLFAQDQQRIHFGLAGNSQVDLQIQWPSGIIQDIPDVTADQVLRVVEPVSSPSSTTLLQSVPTDGFRRNLTAYEPLSGSDRNAVLSSSGDKDTLVDSLGRGDSATDTDLDTDPDRWAGGASRQFLREAGVDINSFSASGWASGLLRPEQGFISLTDLLTVQISELVSL